MMEHLQNFLNTSSIHGLTWISGSERFSKLFWILVVIGGFIGAGFLIHESFYNWNQNPVSTNIETLPISEITFPNITVCPPKNSFLNLNYDVMHAHLMKIDGKIRRELYEFSVNVLQNHYYEEAMKELLKITDNSRFFNWYHGLTRIKYPYHDDIFNFMKYELETIALSGNISTQYFGEIYDVDKINTKTDITMSFYVPDELTKRRKFEVMFKIFKVTLKEISSRDEFFFNQKSLNVDQENFIFNITGGIFYKTKVNIVNLDRRRLGKENIRKLNELETPKLMPGFNIVWNYDIRVETRRLYRDYPLTKYFRR